MFAIAGSSALDAGAPEEVGAEAVLLSGESEGGKVESFFLRLILAAVLNGVAEGLVEGEGDFSALGAGFENGFGGDVLALFSGGGAVDREVGGVSEDVALDLL